MTSRPGSRTRARVRTVEGERASSRSDYLATEEPLEIRLVMGADVRTVAVTMRTPGADYELAAGFLFSEGVIGAGGDIRRMTYCSDPEIDPEQQYNMVNVELDPGLNPELEPLERHFYTTSACGVCGKASLDALSLRGCSAAEPGPQVSAQLLGSLPQKLRDAQRVFESTGGLHACGLFDASGALIASREDVGRHNAVDKVVGWALLNHRLPLRDHLLMVSGRSSFEILQKALAAGISFVCAVSAPSSLAVDLAKRFQMTLVGFLRDERFNVYAGSDRIRLDGATGNAHAEGSEQSSRRLESGAHPH